MNQEQREQNDPEVMDNPVENFEDQESRGRNLVEILLDPRTLQGLMASGAGVLVIGLVAWLWSIGVFENPVVMASCLGVANAAVVVGGVTLVRHSRYQTAGKAITMLGCLVMPLNLWFYDAQGLITLDQGGHLWVPAVVCCLVYAVVARVLADPKFVFAIVGGVTMTGLLLLADQQVARFWEILSPSALMVAIGMICIHAERAFAPGDGPFGREKFGKAFFQAGHVVLATGLMLLLGGRLAGWLYDPVLADLGWFVKPAVSTQTNLKFFALLLALGGVYSYVYSQIVVKARGRYVASAVLTLLWSTVILLDLLAIPFTMGLVALLLAAAALALNLASNSQVVLASDKLKSTEETWQRLMQSSAVIVTGLHVVVAVLGMILYGRVRLEAFHKFWPNEFDAYYLIAMFLAMISCVVSAIAAEKRELVTRMLTQSQSAAAFAMLFTAGLMSVLGKPFGIMLLALEMMVPLSLATWSLISVKENRRRALARAAELATSLLLVAAVAAALGLTAMNGAPGSPHMWLTLLFGQIALCFGLTAANSQRIISPVLSVTCLSVAVWQAMLWFEFTQFVPIHAATIVGLLSVIAGRFLGSNSARDSIAKYFQYGGWIAVSLGSVSTVWIGLIKVLVSEVELSLLTLLAIQTTATALTGLLTKESAWKRFFFVIVTIEALVTLLAINTLSPFTMLQKSELMLTLGGLAMLGFGYRGWYRESGKQDELVSFNLAFGSIFSAVPIVMGMLHHRFWDATQGWGWVMLHEIGVLAIGMLLLGAGLVCRIRWSTLVGGSTLAIYIVSLLGLINLPDQLQTTAVYMMVGGGAFFGVAVLLSIYRDRLLTLPDKLRDGEGVFQVLKWR